MLDVKAKTFLDAKGDTVFGSAAAYGIAVVGVLVVFLLFGPSLPVALLFWLGACVIIATAVAIGLAALSPALNGARDLAAFSKFTSGSTVIALLGVGIVWFQPKTGLAAGLMAMVIGSALSSLGLVWLAQSLRSCLFKRG